MDNINIRYNHCKKYKTVKKRTEKFWSDEEKVEGNTDKANTNKILSCF